jgi:hypothetical protein
MQPELASRFLDYLSYPAGNELVDWFNQVDATYRTDLRELNELNFARFDAKLEQRVAELDAKWRVQWDQLRGQIENGLARQKAEFTRLMFAFGSAPSSHSAA